MSPQYIQLKNYQEKNKEKILGFSVVCIISFWQGGEARGSSYKYQMLYQKTRIVFQQDSTKDCKHT